MDFWARSQKTVRKTARLNEPRSLRVLSGVDPGPPRARSQASRRELVWRQPHFHVCLFFFQKALFLQNNHCDRGKRKKWCLKGWICYYDGKRERCIMVNCHACRHDGRKWPVFQARDGSILARGELRGNLSQPLNGKVSHKYRYRINIWFSSHWWKPDSISLN